MSMSVSSSLPKRFTVYRTAEAMRLARKRLDPNLKVGFVPTMGALHEGHLSLMRKAATENDIVIASIFVNPTQFAPHEDLDRYPRTWDRDQSLLQESGAIDMLFAPKKMYEDGHIMYVDPDGSYFDHLPEAKIRPGHVRGVATIVTKLLNIVNPDNAYFGQKDAAQCVLVRRLVRDLDMDVNVVIGETIREVDGLAMSSRNAYLSSDERAAAGVLYRALQAAKILHSNAINNSTSSKATVSVAELRQAVQSVLDEEPLVKDLQYIAVDDYDTMQTLPDDKNVNAGENMIVSLACKIGQVRLIDNMVLSSEQSK
ncbi:hypothetical protein ACA910_017204 [Epithemia clementina (nom. ined.)]